MTNFSPGDSVRIEAAGGDVLFRRAVSGVEKGDTFPIVWACKEEEWMAAERDGRPPAAVPWPAEDVSLATQVGATHA